MAEREAKVIVSTLKRTCRYVCTKTVARLLLEELKNRLACDIITGNATFRFIPCLTQCTEQPTWAGASEPRFVDFGT
jgi:hypothetical protein